MVILILSTNEALRGSSGCVPVVACAAVVHKDACKPHGHGLTQSGMHARAEFEVTHESRLAYHGAHTHICQFRSWLKVRSLLCVRTPPIILSTSSQSRLNAPPKNHAYTFSYVGVNLHELGQGSLGVGAEREEKRRQEKRKQGMKRDGKSERNPPQIP